jgi:hypothetical protein
MMDSASYDEAGWQASPGREERGFVPGNDEEAWRHD